jgi:hypothetical protein
MCLSLSAYADYPVETGGSSLIDIDAQVSARQRQEYPCYVDEQHDAVGIEVPDIVI